LIIFVEINNNYSSLNPLKFIETFNNHSLLLSFNPSKLIWAFNIHSLLLSFNPLKLIWAFNNHSLLLSFNPSKLIWALPSPISQFQNTGSVAFVLHSVPVFCPPKKADKRTGFSKKEKPYASHLTRDLKDIEKAKSMIYNL
jgi:hypothetical protein